MQKQILKEVLVMMKKYNLDWKVFAYTLVWAVVLRFGKGLFVPEEIPAIIFYWIGVIFLAVSVFVAVIERRMDQEFFYAWGKNWKGMPLSNSSMIAGVGIGIMPLEMVMFMGLYLSACMVITLIKNVVKVNEKHVNAEKRYPIA